MILTEQSVISVVVVREWPVSGDSPTGAELAAQGRPHLGSRAARGTALDDSIPARREPRLSLGGERVKHRLSQSAGVC